MVKRTVKSTSIAKVPKATMAFDVPPGEQSTSAEEFRVYPGPQVSDDTSPNGLKLYVTWLDGPLMFKVGQVGKGAHGLVSYSES